MMGRELRSRISDVISNEVGDKIYLSFFSPADHEISGNDVMKNLTPIARTIDQNVLGKIDATTLL